MILDHANRWLWSRSFPALDEAGRLVFPLFAMVVGFGLAGRRPASTADLFWRLVALAVAAQFACLPLDLMGLRSGRLNVLWTLAAGLLLVHGTKRAGGGGVAVAAVGFVLSWFSEYGPPGAVLVWAAWRAEERSDWTSQLLLWVALGALAMMQRMIGPLLVPAFVAIAMWMCGDERMRSPRMLFGLGYVLQFAAFALLAWWAASAGA